MADQIKSSPTRPRVGDGIRHALAEFALLCDEGAKDQREARHTSGNPVEAMMHANIDAELMFQKLADRARRLRR